MGNAQTGLKSSRPLDRADYLQTGRIQSGMNVNTNKFQTGLSCALCFGKSHARQIAVKNNNGRQGNKSKDM